MEPVVWVSPNSPARRAWGKRKVRVRLRVIPGPVPELDTAALHQIDALVEDLVDAGFDPLVDEDELTVELTPCAQASGSQP